MFDMTNLDEMVGSMGTSQEVIWLAIKAMSDEETKEALKP